MSNDVSKACGETVSRDVLTLDGQMVDVHVLRVGKTLLYVPASWFAINNMIQDPDGSRNQLNPSRNLIDPLIIRGECIGQVHSLMPNKSLSFNLDNDPQKILSSVNVFNVSISHPSDPEGHVYEHTQVGEPDEHGWAQVGKGNTFIDLSKRGGADEFNDGFGLDSPRVASLKNSGTTTITFPNYSSQLTRNGFRIGYSWPEDKVPEPRWRALRKPMHQLANWLATPPRDRAEKPDLLLGEE